MFMDTIHNHQFSHPNQKYGVILILRYKGALKKALYNNVHPFDHKSMFRNGFRPQ